MKGIFAVLYTIVNLIFAPLMIFYNFVEIIGFLISQVLILVPILLGFLPTPFLVMGISITVICILLKIFNR